MASSLFGSRTLLDRLSDQPAEHRGLRLECVEMSHESTDRNRQAFVQEAVLRLEDGIDPASVGAAVTTELCGHWEHPGPCHWPHNNAISGARFRTLFIAHPRDEGIVRERITHALAGAAGVSVMESTA